MIRKIFRFAKLLFEKCFSYLICYSRRNQKKILGGKTLSNLLSITANVRKTYSNLHLNNCVRGKCKHVESCVIPQSAVSSNKNEIPKVKELQIIQTSVKPDVPNLTMLFQAVGFQLREFEKIELAKEENVVPKKSIKVTIQCGSSQMKAVLEMDEIECQCPSSKEAKEGSLWSICGTGQTLNDSVSSSKYEESGSNLLPTIPKGVNNVVRDVVYRLFKIMNAPSPITSGNSNSDVNVSALGNVEGTESPNLKNLESIEMFRSYTQPNIPSIRVRSSDNKLLTSKNLFRTSLNENNGMLSKIANSETKVPEKTLQRQKTWHMDADIDSGRNSSNTLATPVDEMCDSLGHISVGSEDDKTPIGDLIFNAYLTLDKVIRLMTKSAVMTSSALSLNNDFFDNPPPPPVSTAGTSSPKPKSTSRPESACSIPTRISQKTVSQKPPIRKSLPTPISRKPPERPPTGPESEISTTPMRRKSCSTATGPQKTIPLKIPAPRTRTSSGSMNSTTLSDKVVLSARRGSSPCIKNSPLAPKKNTFGPNTSIRGPLATNTSKSTATGTPGSTKFGFSRK